MCVRQLASSFILRFKVQMLFAQYEILRQNYCKNLIGIISFHLFPRYYVFLVCAAFLVFKC